MKRVIQTKPEPWCPECGMKMVLIYPNPEQLLGPYWRCSRHPECHGILYIGSDGKAERGGDRLDDGM
jgi:ssDNA-binding Zn-finger/Zn-ribbon topoisomerase 1